MAGGDGGSKGESGLVLISPVFQSGLQIRLLARKRPPAACTDVAIDASAPANDLARSARAGAPTEICVVALYVINSESVINGGPAPEKSYRAIFSCIARKVVVAADAGHIDHAFLPKRCSARLKVGSETRLFF